MENEISRHIWLAPSQKETRLELDVLHEHGLTGKRSRISIGHMLDELMMGGGKLSVVSRI